MKEIEKNPAVLAVFSVLFTAFCAVLFCLCENQIAKAGIALFYISLVIITFFRFKSIHYYISDEFFIKKSGIVFKKTKTVPLDKIVMKSAFSLGKNVFFTLIRTSGSISVIFGEI